MPLIGKSASVRRLMLDRGRRKTSGVAIVLSTETLVPVCVCD